MRIENEAAGSVIGKGGQKVGEIRKISGAQVSWEPCGQYNFWNYIYDLLSGLFMRF